MSKVGIMSMQRVLNYGSFLQAFALKGILEEMGHDVEFVDYKKDELDDSLEYIGQEYTQKENIRHIMANQLRFLIRYNSKVREKYNAIQCTDLFNRRFKDEFLPMLGVPTQRNEHAKADTLVIGSDEVFNIKHKSMELFGENACAKRVISFAASFGDTDYIDIVKEGKCEKLRERICSFDAVSVRDKNSAEIVKRLTAGKIVPQYHLDPVFHYDFSKYIPSIKRKRSYIAVYAYSNIPEEIKKSINTFAQKRGLDIVCLQGYQGDMGEFMNVDPFEVLAYIQNADYLVTTTFHGCVLGSKFNKPMAIYVVTRNNKAYNNESKLGDLIKRLNLTGNVFSNEENFESAITYKINYEKINNIIYKETFQGRKYLTENII